jgi:hypothetical protein
MLIKIVAFQTIIKQYFYFDRLILALAMHLIKSSQFIKLKCVRLFLLYFVTHILMISFFYQVF